MTVAAAIEIGAGGTPAPGQGKAPGAAHGPGRAGAAVFGAAVLGSSPSIAPGAQSFRAGWQSLLASLGSSVQGFSETEAEADQGTTFAQPSSEGTPGKSAVSTSTRPDGAELHLRPEAEHGSEQTGAGPKLSPAGARTGALMTRSVAGITMSASSKTDEKKTAADGDTESAGGSRSAHPVKVVESHVVAAGPLPGLAPAAVGSVPQAMPVAASASSAARSMDAVAPQSVPAALSQVDLQIASPNSFVSPSFSLRPQYPAPENKVSEPAGAIALETAEGFETSAKQGQAQSVASLSAPSGPTLSEAGASAAGEGAPQPVAMRAEGGNPLETPAPNPALTQTLAGYQNPALATAPSQVPALQPATSQAPSQTLAHGQSEIPMQPGNRGVDVLPASMGNDGLNPLPAAASAAVSQSGLHSEVPLIAGNPGSASGGKNVTLRSAHEAGSIDFIQPVRHLVEGQPSGAVVDASAMAHEPAGARGAVSIAGELAAGSAAATTGPDSRETFAALDAEGATGKPAWIHAGAQRAEAGFQDPALGWVSVRADSSGCGVHAELVAGSADAAQALGSHMAGLNAYLAEHHTPVETLTLTSPEGGWSGLGSDKDAGQQMQQGAGQQTGQETAQGVDASSPSGPYPDSSIQSPAASSELPAFFAGLGGNAQAASSGGIHISVMA
ncbi:MAG: hypothetical protein WCA89_07745 [Terracidiphilus sp.]